MGNNKWSKAYLAKQLIKTMVKPRGVIWNYEIKMGHYSQSELKAQ